jgi:plasmid stabilization system protein ParE
MVRRILDAIDMLKHFPIRMKVLEQPPDSKPPVRRLPVNPYIVYFRVFESTRLVEILHVRHGARRQPKRFD